MNEVYSFVAGDAPVLISMPHVGTEIPAALSARMTEAALALPDTDWHVDRLYDFAAAHGVGVLRAIQSRYVIDLNRDPAGAALYPGADNTELAPLTTFARAPVYRPGAEPDDDEIGVRVETYLRPYHDKLEQELNRLRARHGVAMLWDAHSIASEVPRFFAGRLTDFNLGSARGASADPDLIRRTLGAFEGATGFTAVLDGRFTGGHITRRFGRPGEGVHALQLELSQATYMDERPPYAYRADLAARIKPVLERAVAGAVAWARARARR